MATLAGLRLRLTVADDGAGADPALIEQGPGTGLRRLRERLDWLYGGSATLLLARGAAGRGFTASLDLLQQQHDDTDE